MYLYKRQKSIYTINCINKCNTENTPGIQIGKAEEGMFCSSLMCGAGSRFMNS